MTKLDWIGKAPMGIYPLIGFLIAFVIGTPLNGLRCQCQLLWELYKFSIGAVHSLINEFNPLFFGSSDLRNIGL